MRFENDCMASSADPAFFTKLCYRLEHVELSEFLLLCLAGDVCTMYTTLLEAEDPAVWSRSARGITHASVVNLR